MKHQGKISGFAVGLLVAVLAACNGSSSADPAGGVTMAQVNAAINSAITAATDPLKSEIADLKTQIAANASAVAAAKKIDDLYLTIDAPNAAKAQTASLTTESIGNSDNGIQTEATETGCSGLGTFHGHEGDTLHGVSCSGYMYDIDAIHDDGTTHVLPLLGSEYFAQADCVGQAYETNVNELQQGAGVVFASTAAYNDWANAANYYYLPPNPTPVQFTAVSSRDDVGCRSLVPTIKTGFVPLPNVESITHVPSGLIHGPVGMGTP